MDTKTFKLNIEGREIIAEIKNWAERANGEALVRYGDTSVLATCVMSKQAKEGMNFFPLTVDCHPIPYHIFSFHLPCME